MISWFPSGNRGIKLKQSYPVQIPHETKYEVVNVLYDKITPPKRQRLRQRKRHSKAMMLIKLGKQGFSQTSPEASMIIVTNWQNACTMCKESFLWISDSRKHSTIHIHELNINEIRSQSHHNAEMFYI